MGGLLNDNNPFGADGGMFASQPAGNNDEGGAGWADGFGDDPGAMFGDTAKVYDLEFARAQASEVLSSSQGGKQKKSGLQVNACVNYSPEKKQLLMELEFTNESGAPISDFDVMINKNSFGVLPDAPCSKHGITYPGPFETSEVQYLPLKVDKKNADVKNPPKHPFLLQVALKSTLDIFYFNVPCHLHSLVNFAVDPAQRLAKEDFKKFWDMIQADKQFTMEVGPAGPLKPYQGLKSLPDDLTTCLANNGFALMAKTQKQQTGQTMLYFGSKTVNNLPLMFEVAHPGQPNGDASSFSVTYKVPVLPLKPLFEDGLKYILTAR